MRGSMPFGQGAWWGGVASRIRCDAMIGCNPGSASRCSIVASGLFGRSVSIGSASIEQTFDMLAAVGAGFLDAVENPLLDCRPDDEPESAGRLLPRDARERSAPAHAGHSRRNHVAGSAAGGGCPARDPGRAAGLRQLLDHAAGA